MMIWLVMILTGLFTFCTRFALLNDWVSRALPGWLVDALGFVPIAVLTAIIVPAVLLDPVTEEIILTGNARLVAAIIATLIALFTRNVLATISSGLGALCVMQWWL